MAATKVFPATPTENMKHCFVPNIQESAERHDDKSQQKKISGLFECRGCFENYSEDRVPRLLSCGHTLCTVCVGKFTEDQSSCPECNEKQPMKDVNKYATNYSLLRLVRSPPVKEVNVGFDSALLLSKVFNNRKYDDAWQCEAHKNPIIFFCYSCSLWICQDCLVIEHPCPPRGSCRVIESEDALKRIKCKYGEATEEISKDIEFMKKDFDFNMSIHNFCLNHCTKERSHLRIIKRVEDHTEGEREGNESVVKEAQNRLKELADSELTTSPERLASSIQDIISFKKELKSTIKEESDRLHKAMPPMRKHLRLDLKALAGSTRPLYAVLNEGEEAKFARITVKDQRLLVYSLQKGKPTEDCVTVPYGFVKKLIPKQWLTVFFEIGTAEESFGRVYALLYDNVDYYLFTKQMLLMCTGETGVSYKDTCFFKYDENGSLQGGDYEKNDGTGGKTIISGLGNSCWQSIYDQQSKRGALVISQVSTRFSFHLEHQFKDYIEGYAGKIYDGLDILKRVSKLEPVTKGVIRDCGVVIPMDLRYSYEETNCMDPYDDDDNEE